MKIPGPLPWPPLTPPWGDNSQAARHDESADGIERGKRVLSAERDENAPRRVRVIVARRGRAARRTR